MRKKKKKKKYVGRWLGEILISIPESVSLGQCGSPPGVIVADTLSFNAKIGLVDF